MKRVSVIMPCYNDGKYIRDSIDSVLHQTYSEIELIIVDDGSDDAYTVKVINEIEAEGFCRVIHTSHEGASVARNAGIRESSGEYILNLDSDDLIEPLYIEKAVGIIENSQRVGFVYSLTDMFGIRTGQLVFPEKFEIGVLLGRIPNVSALFRKEDWIEVGGFKKTSEYGFEVCDFLLSVMELGRDAVCIPFYYFHYRIKNDLKISRFAENSDIYRDFCYDIYNRHQDLFKKNDKGFVDALLDIQILAESERRQFVNYLSDAQEGSHDRENSPIYTGIRIGETASDTDGRVTSLENQLKQLQSAYCEITNAGFWKITRPIRTFIDLFCHTKIGRVIYRVSKKVLKFFWRLFKKLLFRSEKRVLSDAAGNAEKTDVRDSRIIPSSLSAFFDECEGIGQVFGRETENIVSCGIQKVLLVSHELSLSGAPVALMHFALYLKEIGYFPVIMSPIDGKLREEICAKGIPTVIYDNLYKGDLIPNASHLFSMIVVNTTTGGPLIRRLDGNSIPVMWWIHEAELGYVYTKSIMPESIRDNIHVYCAGSYAKKVLLNHFPNYDAGIFLYYLPDYTKVQIKVDFDLNISSNGKTVFALVGQMVDRKGQDILSKAIRMLPRSVLEGCLFCFAGGIVDKKTFNYVERLTADYPDNVQYVGELKNEWMPAFYDKTDCLVCPSKDDPMPIVVTEALCLSKLVICSEYTGSAALLQENCSGIVTHNNDPKELSDCIIRIHEQKRALQVFRRQARRTYERYFSLQAFQNSISALICRVMAEGDEPEVIDAKVSFVLPVLNGGEDLKRLISVIQSQLGFREIEIVIVDSGSTDGSAEYAEKKGAKVIRIKPEEFSHSGARNLGVQNSTGEYVVLMTQDALPTGPYWTREMARPVLHKGVVAVSCAETPRPDSDLFIRVVGYGHSDMMGLHKGDRIMKMPESQDALSLRRNSNLSDVALFSLRKILVSYPYRNNYAEDIDLGLRLIRDGYEMALLSGTKVIHSHNRPSVYFFKRGIIDIITLNQLFHGWMSEDRSERSVLNCILSAYCAVILFLEKAQGYEISGEGDNGWIRFRNWISTEFEEAADAVKNMDDRARNALLKEKKPYLPEGLQRVMIEIFSLSNESFSFELSLLGDVRWFLLENADAYFRDSGEVFSPELKDEVFSLAEKYVGLVSGNLIGNYVSKNENKPSALNDFAKRYQKNV